MLFSVRKVRPTPIQGCTTNVKIMLKVREKNLVVCSVKGCGEIQKQRNRYFIIIEGNENITEYTKENSLRAVPGPVSKLMDAEFIAY